MGRWTEYLCLCKKNCRQGVVCPCPGAVYMYRVATVREKVWKMTFFPGHGKVREFGFESGKFAKVQKIREKSGNFKIFPKVMVFGNVSMS